MADLIRRMVDLYRKSDETKFVAEVRQYPSRFVEDIANETITVAYIDHLNCFCTETETLSYNNNTSDPWDWENDEFRCRFVIPEAHQPVQTQTPRGISPIAIKGAHVPITSTK